jgi:hypothetical protein
MYDDKRAFADNPADRYAIGDERCPSRESSSASRCCRERRSSMTCFNG